MASYSTPKYDAYSDVFYRRARHYIQADEMRVSGGAPYFRRWLTLRKGRR